jgi:hypothetical protein
MLSKVFTKGKVGILKSRPRILGLVVVILVLAGGVFYFFSIQERPRVNPPKLVSLTKEQKEVDDFLEEYYLAYGNAPITRLVVLFDSDAILSAPNGAVYKGVYAIRSYYVEDIDSFWSFTIDKTTSAVEVRGNEAYATYNIRVGPWYIGDYCVDNRTNLSQIVEFLGRLSRMNSSF